MLLFVFNARTVRKTKGERLEDEMGLKKPATGWRVVMMACLVLVQVACAPGIHGQWQGSGEQFEGRLFQVALDLQKKAPSAVWLDGSGGTIRLAVCGLVAAEDGLVEFRVDPVTPALTCQEMRHPWIVRARMGGHVLVGDVLDAEGRPVGRLRVLRTP